MELYDCQANSQKPSLLGPHALGKVQESQRKVKEKTERAKGTMGSHREYP